MCTVTCIAQRNGYRLGMNRDEKRSRAPGLPPQKSVVDGRGVLGPSEPGGGGWIAVNDRGAALALVNWHAVKADAGPRAASRGGVIPAMSAAASPAEADAALAALPLRRMQPFRVIGVFPGARQIIEWRWNRRRLARKAHPWETRQWVSSGYDEAKARRVRGETFQTALRQRSAGTMNWLRRLHRSHTPETGPFSTCMHRADAATVSYTEIETNSRRAVMRYCAGAPCECAPGAGQGRHCGQMVSSVLAMR